jgi:hypothetical protein
MTSARLGVRGSQFHPADVLEPQGLAVGTGSQNDVFILLRLVKARDVNQFVLLRLPRLRGEPLRCDCVHVLARLQAT